MWILGGDRQTSRWGKPRRSKAVELTHELGGWEGGAEAAVGEQVGGNLPKFCSYRSLALLWGNGCLLLDG